MKWPNYTNTPKCMIFFKKNHPSYVTFRGICVIWPFHTYSMQIKSQRVTRLCLSLNYSVILSTKVFPFTNSMVQYHNFFSISIIGSSLSVSSIHSAWLFCLFTSKFNRISPGYTTFSYPNYRFPISYLAPLYAYTVPDII